MDDKKYVLVKLTTGETVVGSQVTSASKKTITLDNPLQYQILSMTSPIGIKKDILVFKRVFEFTDDTQISFAVAHVVSIAPANQTILDFYFKELEIAEKIKQQQAQEKTNTDPMEEPKGIIGNLNLNFNFEDPEHFQMFMENIQMGIDGLLDEINSEMDIEEDEDFEFEDDDEEEGIVPPSAPKPPKNNIPKRKRAKNRIAPKESLDLPYEKDADPKDPKSWSDNPEDYLK